jgi:hypothetical protein
MYTFDDIHPEDLNDYQRYLAECEYFEHLSWLLNTEVGLAELNEMIINAALLDAADLELENV